MNNERTKTIIDEIKYWKRTRMLPDEYCDFLLALYTKGEDIETEPTVNVNASQSIVFPLTMGLNVLLLPLSLLVIYFTEMGIIMQTVVLSSFVICAWIHLRWLQYRKSDWFFIPLLNVGLMFLVLSVHLHSFLFDSVLSFYIILGLNFFFWVFLGSIRKVKTLFYSGIIGFILLIIYIVS